jgi:FkbM family methyltransferase
MRKLLDQKNKLLKFCTFYKIKAKFLKLLKSYLRQKRLNSIISKIVHYKVKINNIYDVGAFKGEWTNQLYKNSLKNKNFFLFEANIENEEYLSKYNHKYFIEILSNKRKKVKFYSLANTGDSYYLEQTSIYKKIKPEKKITSTLDIIQKKNKLPYPDFLKIDTQGSEIDILKGGKKILKRCKVILLECPIISYNKGAPNLNEYVNYLNLIGFLPFEVGEIHHINNVFVQIDIFFLKKEILKKINNKKILKIFNK